MIHPLNSLLPINNNNNLNMPRKVEKMLVGTRMILICRHIRIGFLRDIIQMIRMLGIMIPLVMMDRNLIGYRRGGSALVQSLISLFFWYVDYAVIVL
jgi:hypothetical protein